MKWRWRLNLRPRLSIVMSVVSFIAVIAGASGVAAAVRPVSAGSQNPIVIENAKPGTKSWLLHKPAYPDQLRLSGYASAPSVNHGDQITLYVTEDAGSEMLTLDVYRMGWYQGNGARLIEEIPTVAGITQPACTLESTRRMVSCANWDPTYVLQTNAAWVTGDYLVKVTDARGYETDIPFTLRDDASAAPILVQNSVDTWQAYNDWGGYSLYAGPPGKSRGYAVTFNRPYAGEGADYFLRYEFNEISWLERSGYNLSYATDVDSDLNPQRLLSHKAVVVLGHSEYWSWGMRNGFQKARDSGVSLAFMGGNDIYYHARFEVGPGGGFDRVLVCYKSWFDDPAYGHNTSQVTGRWRDAPLSDPENSLMGEMWAGNVDGTQPFVVDSAGSWAYAGTGATSGEHSPGVPMNGEFDTVFRNGHTPPGLVILGNGPAIQTSSPAYEVRSLQYQAQCSIGATGMPTSISLTVRSRTQYAVWLMLRTPTGSIFMLAYDSFPTPGKIDYRDFEVDIARSAPLDGRWHKITLQPSRNLSHLGGPQAAGVAGVWIAGQADIASVTIHGQQKHHKAYSINAGPDCGWSEACPKSAPTFCSTAGSTGVIDGSVTSGTDRTYGEYSRFVPLPPVAYTTIYQAASGAWVFDAGNYGWGSGLSGAANDPNAWTVLDGLTNNVLNRMIG